MTRRVLVVAHSGHPDAVTVTAELVGHLESAGFTPVYAQDEAEVAALGELEVAVVLGGDGTILRAAELTRGLGVPLLSINLGHVGFLAESDRDGLEEAARRLAGHDYHVEERGTLDVRVIGPDGVPSAHGWALNEAALEKSDPTRMIEVAIEVDGRPLSAFGCDGVILATSTGSTAHAFSGGGPIVWPNVDGMLLVPLAAHALFARPLVVGPSSVLAVEVLPRSPAPGVLSCDGRRRVEIALGARVEVRRSLVPVGLVRLSPAPFTDRLVTKFALSVDGWRGRRPGDRRSTSPGSALEA